MARPTVTQTQGSGVDRADALGDELRPKIDDRVTHTVFFGVISLIVTLFMAIGGSALWYAISQSNAALEKVNTLENGKVNDLSGRVKITEMKLNIK